ncbi:ATPase, AAA family [Syntrophotalea carbinolica DSM 2380]|uniref:ATPase, AAA family n=1 Tax=Syntrophotalea carbinolica (strain DSM 2380 / NBRC 103641 / GraBd1) TaxID=338963 RepID=Q3A463_SYNC1|nr:MoxR family ATPase [Syntrophotalea carbinolica]ABA88844.1 ATPase, AAA family [Syntrophotalea carbinolica DSM 2380]
MESSVTVKPSLAITILKSGLHVNVPMFLWGPPGIGKSQIVAQVAADLRLPLIDIRAVLLDPVDLRGVPSVDNSVTRWNPPDFLPTEGEGVLFLDELSQAPESVQSSLLQLVLDRKLGEYCLPDGWRILAAGNRVMDGSFSRKISKALGSRFATHLELAVDLDEWCAWAVDNDVPVEISSFLRLRPELLHSFDAKAQGNSFPCPRVWANVGKFLGTLPYEAELPFFAGALGFGAAAEFTSFLGICRDLPDIDAIMCSPDDAEIPGEPSVLYALCGAMSRKINSENVSRAFRYMKRLPTEFQVVWLRDALRAESKLAGTDEFADWAKVNGDLLI